MLLVALTGGAKSPAQPVSSPGAPAGAAAVTSWLTRRAIPLRHVEAGRGFADLQPLRQTLKDARIVGLGETTHGTREFFQVKHRLVEFLVVEMGFRAFALESSFAACEAINEYVVHGKGDPATVLAGQGYVPWDTEEFAELVRWLRAYNESQPTEKQVTFHGLDLWNNDLGREHVLHYFEQYSPGQLPSARSLLGQVAALENKWPALLVDADREAMARLVEPVDVLIRQLESGASNAALPRSPGVANPAAYVRVMKQWLEANRARDGALRSRYMAENLEALTSRSPATKFLVWAHDSHIRGVARTSPTERAATGIWFGDHVRRRHGDAYYAFGLEFSEGSYRTRVLPAGQPPGDLRVVSAPPALEGSLPWHLSRTGLGDLIVDLRALPQDAPVREWLAAPHLVHDAWWGYLEPADAYAELPLRPYYDGIVFIDKTTATRPSAAAAAAVASRAELRF